IRASYDHAERIPGAKSSGNTTLHFERNYNEDHDSWIDLKKFTGGSDATTERYLERYVTLNKGADMFGSGHSITVGYQTGVPGANKNELGRFTGQHEVTLRSPGIYEATKNAFLRAMNAPRLEGKTALELEALRAEIAAAAQNDKRFDVTETASIVAHANAIFP